MKLQVGCKRAAIVWVTLLCVAIIAAAQSEEKFKIRIIPVPLDGSSAQR